MTEFTQHIFSAYRGFESFLLPTSLIALGLTKPSVQWVLEALSPPCWVTNMIHIHQVLRLRMCVPLLHPGPDLHISAP
jgi:hypothetical protein